MKITSLKLSTLPSNRLASASDWVEVTMPPRSTVLIRISSPSAHTSNSARRGLSRTK